MALLALQQPASHPDEQPDVPRLVEAAVVHLAPSMALMASIARRSPVTEPTSETPWPLLVSIVDPTDDLKDAQAGAEPRILLVGWQRLRKSGANSSPHARPATKAELREALLTFPGRAGLLVYSGHAYAGHADAPATGGLVLARTEPDDALAQRAGGMASGDAAAGAQQLLDIEGTARCRRRAAPLPVPGASTSERLLCGGIRDDCPDCCRARW